MPYRALVALRYHRPPVRRIAQWLLASREISNFTYDQSELGKDTIAHMVACATGKEYTEVREYVAELDDDQTLREHVRTRASAGPYRNISDADGKPGRRMAFYVIVRAMKPRLTVEIGTDHGLGTCLIAAALARNTAEGYPGKVYSADIRPDSGWLFAPPYSSYGKLFIGDGRTFLTEISETVDVFINDTMNDSSHELQICRAAEPNLACNAIMLSSWHNGGMMRYAEQSGRSYSVVLDQPDAHWYHGSAMAMAFGPARLSVHNTAA
jgi:hypothetical protein